MAGVSKGAAAGPEDGRQATITHVAARAGVSVATVSRALNGNYPVAPETRKRIERAARELGYVANAHARALAGSRTPTVGIVISDLVEPFYAHIARGVEREAAATGRLCLVAATSGDPQRELAVVDLLLEQRAEAAILVGGAVADPTYTRQMARRARSFASAGSTLVLCGRPSLGADVPTAVVEYDNAGGATAITEYLLAAGHERIAYVGGPTRLSTTIDRLAGHRRALQARGITPDPTLERTGAFGAGFGYTTTRALFAEHAIFTAIFAANDAVASGVLQALRELGVRVPDDISVVGFDDFPVAAESSPPLTTVHVPLDEMGREAVRLALPRTDDDALPQRHVRIGTHIVMRDSVAPPKGRRRS